MPLMNRNTVLPNACLKSLVKGLFGNTVVQCVTMSILHLGRLIWLTFILLINGVECRKEHV